MKHVCALLGSLGKVEPVHGSMPHVLNAWVSALLRHDGMASLQHWHRAEAIPAHRQHSLCAHSSCVSSCCLQVAPGELHGCPQHGLMHKQPPQPSMHMCTLIGSMSSMYYQVSVQCEVLAISWQMWFLWVCFWFYTAGHLCHQLAPCGLCCAWHCKHCLHTFATHTCT